MVKLADQEFEGRRGVQVKYKRGRLREGGVALLVGVGKAVLTVLTATWSALRGVMYARVPCTEHRPMVRPSRPRAEKFYSLVVYSTQVIIGGMTVDASNLAAASRRLHSPNRDW